MLKRFGWVAIVLEAAPILFAQVPQTTTTLQQPANPATFGQSLTLTANVSPGTAFGRVVFYGDGIVLGSAPLTAGTATLATTALRAGANRLVAVYGGAPNSFLPSASSPVSETVQVVSSALLGSPTSTAVGTQPIALAVGTFDTLGLAVVTANIGDNTLSILNGPDTGTLAQTLSVGHPPTAVALGDFNNDGKLDIAVTSGDDGRVYLFVAANSTFTVPATCPGPGCPSAGTALTSIVVADFNLDGNLDLAVGSTTGLTILQGAGDGTFTPFPTTYLANGPPTTSLVTGDFNRDGIIDLAALNGNTVYTLLGRGDGTFTQAACPGLGCIVVGVRPVSLVAADFDRDGLLDLAIADSARTIDNLIVLKGVADGSFSAFTFCLATGLGCPSAGVTAGALAVTDANNDGINDLLVANIADNSVSVLLGFGNGAFGSAINFPVGSGPVAIAVANLNRAARTDVITVNTFSNDVTVLPGQQAPTATAIEVNPSPSVPSGQQINFLATVSGASETPFTQLTGNVTFSIDGAPQTPEVLTGGTASLLVSLPDGPHTITVAYSGDGASLPSNAPPVTVTAGGSAQGTMLFLTPVLFSPAAGQPIPLTAALVSASGSGVPNASIALSEGATLLGTAITDSTGLANFTISPLTPGTHVVFATYAGAPGLNPSFSSLTLAVSLAGVAVGLNLAPNPAAPNQPVALTATVRPISGSPTPTGTITFSDGGQILGQPVTLNSTGQATSTAPLVAGVHRITATYSGPSSVSAASASLSEYVGSGTQTAVSVPSSAAYGSNVQLVANVTPANATGSVTFYDGVTVLGSAILASGAATLRTPLLSPGTRSVAARYLGDTNNGPSLSAPAALVITPTAEGALGSPSPITTGAAVAVVIADFNNDGKPDLACSIDLLAVVFLGNGDGTFTAGQTVGSSVSVLQPADLNADGKIDLIADIGDFGSILVYYGNGDGTFQSGVLVGASGLQSLLGIATADSNSDGRSDLLIPQADQEGSLGFTALINNGDGTFQPTVRYPSLTEFALGDFNGDAQPDLAAPNDTSSISILLGNGDGTFRAAANVPFAGGFIVVADVNGDGKQDLIFANLVDKVVVLLGNGDGTFTTEKDSTFPGPRAVSVTDWNADGKLDLVVSGVDPATSTGTLTLALGNGDGTFNAEGTYNIGPSVYLTPQTLGVADFNGDGRPDVVVATLNGLSVLLGAPASPITLIATPNPASVGQSVTLTATDPDGTGTATFLDGTAPLGTADVVNGEATLTTDALTPGTHSLTATIGNFASPPISELILASIQTTTTLSSSTNPATLGVPLALSAQVTASGSPVGSVTFYSGTTVLGVVPLQNATASLIVSTLPPGTQNLTARFDGAVPYLASVSAPLAQTVKSVAASSLKTGVPYQTGAGPDSIIAGDFNGDGKTDLVVGNGNGPLYAVLLGNGDGTFTAGPTQPPPGGSTSAMATADFNNDGIADLAQANRDGVVVFAGRGDGGFAALGQALQVTGTVALATADLNGDGNADLIAVQEALITPCLGKGDGTITPGTPITTGTGSVGMTIGDFNGDNLTDLAVANAGDGTVSIFLGAGDGTFRPAINSTLSGGPTAVVAGDWNGDGKLDLAVSIGGSNNVSILLGVGDGTFGAPVNYSVGSTPSALALVDFNADGKPDLAVADRGSGDVGILLGNGDGTFGGVTPHPAGTSPIALVAGSFTGSGLTDVAVADNRSNAILVLLGVANGPAITNGPPPAANIDAPYNFAFTATGGTTPYTWSQTPNTGTLPPGLTLSAPGVLSGTATTLGDFPLNVTVTDAQGLTTTGTFAIHEIQPQPTATIASIPILPGGTVGSPYAFQPSTSANIPGAFANWSATGLPAGLTINATTGQISGTPSAAASAATVVISAVFVPGPLDPLTGDPFSGGTTPVDRYIPVSQQTSITLLATANPLTAAPQSLSFSATPAQLVPVPQQLTITGTNAVSVTASASTTSGGKWLTIAPSSGNTPLTITASANGTQLVPGTYQGIIAITAAGIQTINVPVTFTVGAPPAVVSPSALSFTANAGLPAPLPQAINITTGSAGIGFTASTSSESWLSVSPVLGTTPATINAAVDATGLPQGTYNAKIFITFNTVVDPGQTIPVTLNIPAPGTLALPPGDFTFDAVSPGKLNTQTFTLASSNGGSIPFTIAVDSAGSTLTASNLPHWLADTASTSPSPITVSPLSGATPALISITVDPTGLALGQTTTHTLSFTSFGTAVTRKLTISTAPLAPTLVVSPPVIQVQAQQNSISTMAVAIQNTGGSGNLPFTAFIVNAANTAWLSLPVTNGTTNGSAAISIPLNVNTANLAAGVYRATLHVTMGDLPPQDIPISITVQTPAPTMALGFTGATLQFRAGQGLGLSQAVPVLDLGKTAFDATTTVDAVGAQYISVTPTLSSAPGAPGTLTASVNPAFTNSAQTQPGLYYATVTVKSDQAANSPQLFLVVVDVQDPAKIPARPVPVPAGLVFTAAAGTDPAPQSFQVFTSSSTAVPFQAAAQQYSGQDIDAGKPANWLYVLSSDATSSTSTTGAVQIAARTAGLAPGVYTGGITVAMSDTVRTVHVTLTVTAGAPVFQTGRKATIKAADAPTCTRTNIYPTFVGGLPNGFANQVASPTPIAVQVIDNCGKPVPDSTDSNDPGAAFVLIKFSAGDPQSQSMQHSGNGVYTIGWTPDLAQPAANVNVQASLPGVTGQSGFQIEGDTQTSGQTADSTAPVLAPNKTLNNLNPRQADPLAPGTIVAIYGRNFQPPGQTASAGSIPLPTDLNKVRVTIGGIAAPLYFAGEIVQKGEHFGQINAQIPVELQPNTPYPIQVNVDKAFTVADEIMLVPATPGSSYLANVIAQKAGYITIDANHPVPAGDVVTLYADGLGATDPSVPSGAAAPTDPLARVVNPVTVAIDGAAIPAENISFAGLTPMSVGLYQINFTLPASTTPGKHVVTVIQNNFASGDGLIYVGNP